MTKIRESTIERKVVEYFEKEKEKPNLNKKSGGFVCKIKLSSPSGMPDRMFVRPDGKTLYVEFKQKGLKLQPMQSHIIDKLRSFGFQVVCVDNMKFGELVIDEFVKHGYVSEERIKTLAESAKSS